MDTAVPLPDDLLDILKGDSERDILEVDFLSGLLSDIGQFPDLAFNPEEQTEEQLAGAAPVGTSHEMASDVDIAHMSNNYTSDHGAPAGGSYNSVASGGHEEGMHDAAWQAESTGGAGKKKRYRNPVQMEMNRQAQRQYRERKKSEQSGLQHAVDLLTAELAAMKAIELRAKEMEKENAALLTEKAQQLLHIQDLEQQLAEKDQVIANQEVKVKEQADVIAKTQSMILDQHERLKFQEEIITNLKEELKKSVDEVWENMSRTDPKTVCNKMHEAVRAALMDAKDMDGLQETLANLPDHIVVQIIKNILHACKDMWPQVHNYFSKACRSNACASSSECTSSVAGG